MKIKIIDYSKPGALMLPKRAHYNDAGADVYNPSKIYVANGATAKINLGFGVELPDGYFGLVYIRSSMAAKGLSMEMPPIDSGYTGPIHALITNHTGKTVMLDAGERIGQLVIQPVVIADFIEHIDVDDERGTGAFGSTGK